MTSQKQIYCWKGEVLIIPANKEHEFIALEDTIDIDAFSPLRQDWLSGETVI